VTLPAMVSSNPDDSTAFPRVLPPPNRNRVCQDSELKSSCGTISSLIKIAEEGERDLSEEARAEHNGDIDHCDHGDVSEEPLESVLKGREGDHSERCQNQNRDILLVHAILAIVDHDGDSLHIVGLHDEAKGEPGEEDTNGSKRDRDENPLREGNKHSDLSWSGELQEMGWRDLLKIGDGESILETGDRSHHASEVAGDGNPEKEGLGVAEAQGNENERGGHRGGGTWIPSVDLSRGAAAWSRVGSELYDWKSTSTEIVRDTLLPTKTSEESGRISFASKRLPVALIDIWRRQRRGCNHQARASTEEVR
jgi:hypothetical protein